VSDTPRTDEFFYERARGPGVYAWLRYARTIERELDAAKAALDAALAEPDAKREPATDKQVKASYRANENGYWVDYRYGWQAAERFHGITKEDA
jgi:hypothetical protein